MLSEIPIELVILTIVAIIGLLGGAVLVRHYPFGICLVLGLAFFQGVASYVGIPGLIYGLAIDASVLLALGVAVSIARTRSLEFRAPFFGIFAILTAVFIISAFLNHSDAFTAYRMLRNTLFTYLFFLAIINLPINRQGFMKLNRFVAALFVMQIGAAIFKFLKYGQREGVLNGTFAGDSGAVATIFPLFAFGYLAALFLLYKRSYWWVILALGFVFMSWVSGKRGFVFVLPMVLFGSFFFYQIKELKASISPARIVATAAIVAVGMVPVFYVLGRAVPTLNPDGERGGRFDAGHMVEYAIRYHFAHRETEGITRGRMATLVVAARHISKSTSTFFFGYGPDAAYSISRSDGVLQSRFQVLTFHTGLNIYLISLGLVGVGALLLLYWKAAYCVYRRYELMPDGYWRAVCMGTVVGAFVFSFDFLSYSPVFVHGYIPSMVYFYFVAAIIKTSEDRFVEDEIEMDPDLELEAPDLNREKELEVQTN